jgi:PII-like signaling protein
MQGYQISFMTELNRRIDGRPPSEWLMQIAKELGIGGVTTFAGVEGVGADGRRHSARFFELVDQPIEIMMAVSEAQAVALFEKINGADTRLFYIKIPIEYGELGTQATPTERHN